MLPLKTILIHRLEKIAREVDDEISDFLAGAIINDDVNAINIKENVKSKNTTIMYYSEVYLYKI